MRQILSGRQALLLIPALLTVICLVSAQSTLLVGYSVYRADAGSKLPVGSALFRVSDSNGTVVSEAGVGAADPIRNGRVFVDEVGTKMGLALVNANPNAASITFILLNASGSEVARKTQTLPANQHMAAYVSEVFGSQAVGLRGSLTFQSDQPLAAITLRENRNRLNEPLYTTLPVTDLAAPTSTDNVVFPHIVAGSGFITEVLLMNPTTSGMSGDVFFYDNNGQPVTLLNGTQSVTLVHYSIPPNGTFRAALTAAASVSGWAKAVPASGNPAPSGSAIFQWTVNNIVVSEAGVAATKPLSTARIFVDYAQTQTGVAIVNPSSTTANLALTLMDRNGNVAETQTRAIAGGNHLALYAHELFSTANDGFTGLMEIRSDIPVAPITLKLTTNARGDLVLTTLPVADMARLSSATTLIFPQIAIGGPFSTRLILISTDTATASSGNLAFFQSDSTAMVVAASGSQFVSRLAAGGGRQFYPGNSATVAAITVVDPVEGKPTTEITINEGSTVRPRLRLTDTAGAVRDDFDVAIQSLDPTIASADNIGNIRGERAGFSTVTLSSGGVITTTTATVVHVNAGTAGLGVQGIAKDLANRLYLAASTENAILLAQDLKDTPVTYAGIRKSPGLKNSTRLDSQFRTPAFLALNQALGTLYVSDGANNVIRRVTPGVSGVVQTLAGTGSAGSANGALLQASFNNPQGVALDGRGNLWVADSGNHTIRRLNLQTGIVETIAGSPGSPGLADGKGTEARFRGPLGLAIQNETTAQQLERERLNLAAPPVRVLVADAGNNVIRRVTEDGTVETIGATNVSPSQASSQALVSVISTPVAPTFLNVPTAVASDPFGNVFVTESKAGRVKTLLNTGNVVTAAGQTFSAPSGLATTDGGKLVVADANVALQELVYGAPSITSVTPSSVGLSAGTQITITGQNFAPDSVVTISRFIITDRVVINSKTITLKTPVLPGGRLPVVVRHRGGLAQATLVVNGPGLNDLPAGYITTVVGADASAADGTLATQSPIANPGDMAIDQAGNLFVIERILYRVRRIDAATKVITTAAGTTVPGPTAEAIPATQASINLPNSIAIDTNGNLLIADSSNRIRRVDAITNLLTTIAGTGVGAFGGDNGPAKLASFEYPGALVTYSNGDIYVADNAARIRKIDGKTGIITTVIGNGVQGYSGENVPATQASINLLGSGFQKGLVLDRDGNVFFTDLGNKVVRRVDAVTGLITRFAGTGIGGLYPGDGVQATSATMSPAGLALDNAGDLLIGDRQFIRKVSAGIVRTVAGIAGPLTSSGDNGLAINAAFRTSSALASDAAGNFFISDVQSNRIRRVDTKTGLITTFAGTGVPVDSLDGDLAKFAHLVGPSSISINGNRLFVTEGGNAKIRQIDMQTGIITTLVGTGVQGFSPDNTPAAQALISNPAGVVADPFGNVYILDRNVNRLRMVSAATQTIVTVAGNGTEGFSGDGGPGTLAALSVNPVGPTFYTDDRQLGSDSAGNIFIPDVGNSRVRRLDRQTGIITTVAGNGQRGFSGDGGPATAASFFLPGGVTVDTAGNLFITDTFNNRIRKVDAKTGIITTVAGSGPATSTGDGGLATLATLDTPLAVALDAAQNLYITERNANKVRKVNAQTGIITTVAGRGGGFAGDGGPATNASFAAPGGITFDGNGNLFVIDGANNRVRAIRGPIP